MRELYPYCLDGRLQHDELSDILGRSYNAITLRASKLEITDKLAKTEINYDKLREIQARLHIEAI